MTYSVHKKSKRELSSKAFLEVGLASFLNSVNGSVVSVIYEPADVIVVTHYQSKPPDKK